MADPEKRSIIPLYSLFDNTANENSKAVTVPSGQVYFINWLHLIYTSSATAGNRQVKMKVEDDSANLLLDIHAGAVQAASLTYHYSFMQGVYRETSLVDNSLQVPIPKDLYLDSGWVLTVFDDTDVDSADDLVFSGQVFRYAR